MPRYFLQLDGKQTFVDRQGVDLIGLDAAQLQAVRFAEEFLFGKPEALLKGGSWQVRMSDEDRCVFILRIEAALL